LVAYRTFLELNGTELMATDEEKYVSILALAEDKLSERDFATWLREHLRPAARGEAHEPRRAYRMRRSRSRSVA
jgi:death-on-curing protein